MPAKTHPSIHVRLNPADYNRLRRIADARRVNLSRCVRQLIGEADVETRPQRHLSEEELLDLMTTRAQDGNVSAIRALLEIERQKDPRQGALEVLQRMAEERRQ